MTRLISTISHTLDGDDHHDDFYPSHSIVQPPPPTTTTTMTISISQTTTPDELTRNIFIRMWSHSFVTNLPSTNHTGGETNFCSGQLATFDP